MTPKESTLGISKYGKTDCEHWAGSGENGDFHGSNWAWRMNLEWSEEKPVENVC